MPRRNQRPLPYEPLDLTPGDIRKQYLTPVSVDPQQARRERAKRADEARERQHNARVNGGIDWSVCVVPGCGEELVIRGRLEHPDSEKRDHTVALPLCHGHLAVAYQQARASANDALMVKATTLLMERKQERRDQAEREHSERWRQRTSGHIYFVRLNGLVKAGWSRDVHDHLRAYGPLVEVLAIYPGTRDDETNLHRQLRPALQRGREWYEDGKIIADFVEQAVAKHGPPVTYDDWTKPKQTIRPRKRAS